MTRLITFSSSSCPSLESSPSVVRDRTGGLKKVLRFQAGDDGGESVRMPGMFADKAASRCLSEMGFEAIQGRVGDA